MNSASIYKDILLDHYKNPRNRGDLSSADVVRRGSNPRCGDELEIGIHRLGNTLHKVEFRGRGCSVCLASASMMTEAVQGKNIADAERLYSELQTWFDPAVSTSARALQKAQPVSSAGDVAPAGLEALSAVRDHPARRRCVLLAWEALHDAISA